ncbi:MAG: hypothetical protein ACP5K5_01015, partial [Candidatus Micrarchaeia archaeon]
SKFGQYINNGGFYQSQSFYGLEYQDGPFQAITDNTLWTWYCSYVYNYQYSYDLTQLNNTNITIPVVTPKAPTTDYIELNGQYYYPVSDYPQSYLCAAALASGWGYGICGNGWNLVSTNGRIDFNGYNGGANIYTYSGDPGYYIAGYWGGFLAPDTASAPITQISYSYVPILPYFLDNISMPALFSTVSNRTEYMNLSFDMYSPHNYLQPSNYLDPFPLFTDSGFFANYNSNFTVFNIGIASLSSTVADFLPTTNIFLSSLTSSQISAISNVFDNLLSRLGSAGNYAYLSIKDPQFIAASPNDYIYVINYTNSNGFGLFSSSSSALLYTFRFVPIGYYNVSNDQPSTVQCTSCTWSTWNSLWKTYWNNTLKEQSTDLYLVNVTNLTHQSSTWWGFSQSGMAPTAVTSDYSNDVFFTGYYAGKSGKFFIGALFSNGTKKLVNETQPSGFLPSQEFAVSPGGQNLYLANESYPGNIVLYQSPSLNYEGEINLTYSNSTYNMSIAQYLKHGGPFHNKEIADAYSSVSSFNDIASFHYPIGIIDQEGLLYVFDFWNFSINGMPSSFLIMRVFTENNTEIPIDAQNYTTMFPTNSQEISTSQGNTQVYWPPYGWVLSANISIGNGQYISYCAAGCTNTPSSLGDVPYPPIGPWITALGINATGMMLPPTNLSLSSSFNGTFNMLAHVESSQRLPIYTEFLTFQPKIENYTKISFAAYTPYSCYINESQYSNGACTYNAIIANTISMIEPPFLAVPSSFSYVESEGSPEAYFTLTNTLSSLFPQQTANSKTTSGAKSFSSCGITSSQSTTPKAISNIAGISPAFFSQPTTFLNSGINGYVLVPYNYSYYLYQNIQQVSATPFGITTESVGTPSDMNNDPVACGDISSTSDVIYQGYTSAPVPVAFSLLNETVQGGPTYLQYVAQNLYYMPNVSDASAIMLPYINYRMSTNRNLGEIFINQTINATVGMLSPQLVINAANNYNYQIDNYMQSAFGTTYPGYAAEIAIPQQTIGANCGGNCPVPYYYASNFFNGQSSFSYTETSATNFAQLFDVYKRASYLNSMILNMSKSTNIFGYNRLLFTYVDMFNNTIYMPLDVDFANTTTILMNVTPIVNAENSNQTVLKISGTLLSATPFGIEPVPNANVLIYFDTNINYYNSSTSTQDFLSNNLDGYFARALNCSFGNGYNCTLANPLASITQSGGAGGLYESMHIDYSPQFNISHECPPQASSLLASGNIKFNCNIYGYNGLKAARYNTTLGYYQYCIPYFMNGTGVFTSQLGLANVVKTDSNGNFTASITSCGTEDAKIIAQYYGNPPPEPIYVKQTGLSFSTPNSGGTASNYLEYNYSTAPSSIVVDTQIGNFMLSFGSLNVLAILAIEIGIGVAVYIKIAKRQRHGK